MPLGHKEGTLCNFSNEYAPCFKLWATKLEYAPCFKLWATKLWHLVAGRATTIFDDKVHTLIYRTMKLSQSVHHSPILLVQHAEIIEHRPNQFKIACYCCYKSQLLHDMHAFCVKPKELTLVVIGQCKTFFDIHAREADSLQRNYGSLPPSLLISS